MQCVIQDFTKGAHKESKFFQEKQILVGGGGLSILTTGRKRQTMKTERGGVFEEKRWKKAESECTQRGLSQTHIVDTPF